MQPLSTLNDELTSARRALRAASAFRAATTTSRDAGALLREFCRIAVDVTGYRFAWIGTAVQDAARSVTTLAEAGVAPGYVEALRLTWLDAERGRGPTGSALREHAIFLNEDSLNNPIFAPWREEALLHGLRSSIALPFEMPDGTPAALTLYAHEASAFDDAEVTLLRELVVDLEQRLAAFGVRRQRRLEVVADTARGVVHDVNNALGVIKLCASVLDRAEDGERHEAVGAIQDAVDHAAKLVAQIALVGRGGVGCTRKHDLHALVESMRRVLHVAVGPSIQLEIERDDAPLVACVEAGTFEQALLNLTINARHAMPDGGTLRIDTRRRVDARGHVDAILSVRDTGHGIAPEDRARVFETGFTTKRPGEGSGLGLASVVRLAREHGGRVELESEIGRGTTFHVVLPACTDGHVVAAAKRGAPASATILLVEDDPLLRGGVGRMLRALGHRVVDVESWSAARDSIRRLESDLDLVLTDLLLCDGNGLDLVEELSRDRPSVPAIVMTGSVIDERERTRSGVVFLQKPFDRCRLDEAIRTSLVH